MSGLCVGSVIPCGPSEACGREHAARQRSYRRDVGVPEDLGRPLISFTAETVPVG